MKKIFLLLFVIVLPLSLQAQGFRVELEQVSMPGTPNIHSFAHATANGKWLFVGGRTNGLHGINTSNAFPRGSANTMLWVIDPNTSQTWSRSIYSDLTPAAADPLRSTNMQYVQDGSKLYLTGGYGIDTLGNKFITFPTLTQMDVPNVINAIVNNQSIAPYVKQISDTRMQISGGEMEKVGDYFYLIFGHNFNGPYSQVIVPGYNSQVYSNEIRSFKISESGGDLSITDYSAVSDTANFHRRDLNVHPIVKPGGEFSIIAYGGVFRHGQDLPFLNSIQIDGPANYTINDFEQKIGQYTCAALPMFDASSNAMHTVFFGGMSLYYYDEISQSIKVDSLVPFIDDISVVTKNANGSFEEKVLTDVRLPTYLGTNAAFIHAEDVPHYSNGVLKLNELTGRTFAGYIFGGIKSAFTNPGTMSQPTSPNDIILKVYVTRTTGITQNNSEIPTGYKLEQNYPNPFNPTTNIKFALPKSGAISLKVYNMLGKEVAVLVNKDLQAGEYTVDFNAVNLASGIYFYKLQTNEFSQIRKMSLVK